MTSYAALFGLSLLVFQSTAAQAQNQFSYPAWTLANDGYSLSIVEGHGQKTVSETDSARTSTWATRFAIKPYGKPTQWLVDCKLIDATDRDPYRQISCLGWPQVSDLSAWTIVATADKESYPTGYIHDGQRLLHFKSGNTPGSKDPEARQVLTLQGTQLILVDGFRTDVDPTRLETPFDRARYQISEDCRDHVAVPCPALGLLIAGLHQLRPEELTDDLFDQPTEAEPTGAFPQVSPKAQAQVQAMHDQSKLVSEQSKAHGYILARHLQERQFSPPGLSPALGPDHRFKDIGLVLDVLSLGVGGMLYQPNRDTSTDLYRPGNLSYAFDIGVDFYDFVRFTILGTLSFSSSNGCEFDEDIAVPELYDGSIRDDYLSCYRRPDKAKAEGNPDYLRIGLASDITALRLEEWHLRVGVDYSYANLYSNKLHGQSAGVRVALDKVALRALDRPKGMFTGECRVGRATFQNPVQPLIQTPETKDDPIVWEADCRLGLRLTLF